MKSFLCLVLAFWFSQAFAAGNHALEFPVNLKGQQASAVVVLFSLPDCAYCEKVRQQSLRHVPNDAAYKGRVAVYEIDFADSKRSFTWFDGKRYTGKALASHLDVKFSPTVMVYSKSGKPAGQPLLGAGLPEFYGGYLDELIQAAFLM